MRDPLPPAHYYQFYISGLITNLGGDAYEQLVVTRPDGSNKVLQRGVDIYVVAWEVAGFPCDLLGAPHFTGTAKAGVHGQCQRRR